MTISLQTLVARRRGPVINLNAGRRGLRGASAFYRTLAYATAADLPEDLGVVLIERYLSTSRLCPAIYVRVDSQPAHGLSFNSNGWFEIEERYIDIRMAGAMVDGVTDDSAAVSRARVAARATGAIPFLPIGTAIIETPWTGAVDGLVDHDQFEGAHKNDSILKFVGAMAHCIEPDDPLLFTDGVRFRRMSIHGDDDLTKVGLFAAAFRTAELFEVEFDGFTQSPIQSYGERNPDGLIATGFPGDSTYNILWDCDILGGQVPIHLGGNPNSTDRTHGGTSNMWLVIGGRSASGKGIANFYLEQGAAVDLIRHSVVSGAGDGVRVAWYGSTLVGCVSENNGPTGTVVAANVNVAGNYVTLSSNSEPQLGRRVAPTTTGVLPGGLALSDLYEVPTGTTKQTRFASSLANALAVSPVLITITNQGSGTHTFTKVASTWTCAASAVNTTNDTLTLSNGPATLRTGDPIMLSTSSALPSVLSAGAVDPVTKGSTGTVYYTVLTGTANVIQLSLTYIGAISDTPVVIDITNQGTGTHTVTEQLLGIGVRYENVTDCHDNKMLGQHDGGSNDVAFVVDESGNNDVFGSRTGLKLSQAGGSVIMPLALFGKDGHLQYKSLAGDVNFTRAYVAAARHANTPDQTVTNNVATVVTWDTEDFDDYGMINLGSDNTAITLPETGKVEVSSNLIWAANSTGFRRLEILKNGILIGEDTKNGVNGTFTYQTASSRGVKCTAGDVLTIRATQNSGGDLALLHSIANTFYVRYVG